MAADFLLELVQDVPRLVYGIFSLLEFVVGLCYVSGKYLSELIVSALTFTVGIVVDIGTLLQLFVDQLVEFEQQVFRGILLLYYGAGKIVDAFYITFTDLVNFLSHMTWSLSQLAQNGWDVLIRSFLTLTVVPDQLCKALSMIGEFFISFCQHSATWFTYGLYVLIWTPVYALLFASDLLIRLIKIPPQMIAKVPSSAYTGLLVVLLLYFLYCRLSFRRFFGSVFSLLQRAFGLGLKLVQFFGGVLGRSKSPAVKGKDGDGSPEDLKGLCVVCQEVPVAYIANPCSHVALCRDCVHRLVKFDNRCPMCRNVVDTFSRVYIS